MQNVFDRTATTYDAARSRLIPCFEDLYTAAVNLIPPTANRILDLGAGTGLLSAFVRKQLPNAHLHLIDSAKSMLALAEARFTLDENTSWQLGDYTTAAWGGYYDAIISSLSIHHLSDEAKRTLFDRVQQSLNPGGVFVNAEQILAPTPELEAQAKSDWLAEVRALGATEEEVSASLLRQTEDRCATVAQQLLWMRQAGLAGVRCVFEQGRFAVLTGSR